MRAGLRYGARVRVFGTVDSAAEPTSKGASWHPQVEQLMSAGVSDAEHRAPEQRGEPFSLVVAALAGFGSDVDRGRAALEGERIAQSEVPDFSMWVRSRTRTSMDLKASEIAA